jgi:hypothetical protein
MRFRLAAAALISGSLLLGEVDAAGLKRTAPTAATSLSPNKRGPFSNTSQSGSFGRSHLDDIANAVPNDTPSLPNDSEGTHPCLEPIHIARLRDKFRGSKQLILALENALENLSHTPVEAGILRYGGFIMRSDMTAPDFKDRDKVERQKLHDVMKEAYPKVLLNFGDGLMDEIILLIIKHFAPNSSKGYVDPKKDIACFIPRKFTNGKAKKGKGGNVWSLTKHGGGESNDKRKEEVNAKVGITDMCVIITKDTDNHQAEFNNAAEWMHIPLDLLHAVGFLFMVAQVNCNHMRNPEVPLKVLCASAAAIHTMFGDAEPYKNDIIHFLSQAPHGQCIAMKLPLRNHDVWPTDLLIEMDERIRLAFVDIIPVPDESKYLLRAGKRNGMEETKEEREAAIEMMRQNCRLGGRIGGGMARSAFEAFWSGKELTPKQENIVIGCMQGGETVREAFRKHRNKEPMTEKERLIVKAAWRVHTKEARMCVRHFENTAPKSQCQRRRMESSKAAWRVHTKEARMCVRHSKKEDGIVQGCLAGSKANGEASRERSKLAAAARGDSDELLDLVCTRQPDDQTQQCGGTTKGVLTAQLVCPLCGVRSYGHTDYWAMENGSKKPKPKCRYYACIYSGTTHHGPHGLSVRCCGGTANLGTGHFKTVSKARNESRQGAVMELIKKRWDGVKLDKEACRTRTG